ncbi:MAG: domain S-box [Phycisphaerales bacterium]|nr:domain S-box [Phycisphaerales bacterium]
MAAPELDALISDAVPSLVIVFDRLGRIVRFNRACEVATGYSRQEALGRVLWDFLLPGEEVDSVKTVFAKLIAGRLPFEIENNWVTKDGMHRVVAWSGAAALDGGGAVEFVIGTGQDVTAHRWALRDLLASERRYRTMVESAMEGVWVIDTEGRTTYANQSMARMFGYTPPEMLGRSMYDFMDDRARKQAEANMERRRQGVTEAHEFRFRHKGGSDVWTLLSANPLTDDAGRFAGALAMVADITDRKKTEEALRASEERFRAQYENLPLPTFTWQRTGDDFALLSCNKAAAESTRGAAAHMAGTLASELFASQPQVIADIRECARLRECIKREMAYRMQSTGELMDLAVTYAFIPPDLVMVHTEDVGPRRRAEQELLSLNQTLEQRVAERTESNRLLVTEVEHRVGNNLAALLGLVELMRNRATSVDAYADAIQQRLRGMAQVHHLLTDAGWKAVSLRTVAVSALDAIRDAGRRSTEESVDGPDLDVAPGQAQALTLILLEWYTNSCKYGAHAVPGGRLHIQWQLSNGHPGPRTVRLSWTERAGPTPRQPAVPSVGTQLVQAFATRELGGACTMTFPPEGAEHAIEFPLPADASPGRGPKSA